MPAVASLNCHSTSLCNQAELSFAKRTTMTVEGPAARLRSAIAGPGNSHCACAEAVAPDSSANLRHAPDVNLQNDTCPAAACDFSDATLSVLSSTILIFIG